MIRAIGIDAAFAHMGLARVEIDPAYINRVDWWSKAVRCVDLQLVSTDAQNKKVVRKSSDDLRRAIELHRALHAYIRDAQVVFAEIPTGAQSAAAAKYLGAALGILASVPIPIIEVSPLESRQVVSGAKSKGVSKERVIEWAAGNWPDAPWLRHSKPGRVMAKGGKKVLSQWKAGDLQRPNEHLADAMATIAAGTRTPAFQQLLALSHATTSSDRQRPASRRIALDGI